MPPDVGKAPIGHIYTAIHTFRTPKLLFTSVTHCAIFRSSASGFRHAFSTGAYYSRLTQVSQSLQLLSQPDGVYGANTFTQALPASARGGVISVKLDHHFKIADRVQSMTGRYNFVDEKALGLEGVYLIKPNHAAYDFKYNPMDPFDPNKDQAEVAAPPLVGPSLGWDFIATPKTACPIATTATANGQSNPQLCQGQPINLATPTVANATGYQWLFPDGSSRTEQYPVIPSATLSNNGVYRVTVTIAGCPAIEATVNVTVNAFSLDSMSASFQAGGATTQTLTGIGASVYSVAFSPDGKFVVAGGANGEIKVWETASGDQRFNLTGHVGSVNSVGFDADGRWLVSER